MGNISNCRAVIDGFELCEKPKRRSRNNCLWMMYPYDTHYSLHILISMNVPIVTDVFLLIKKGHITPCFWCKYRKSTLDSKIFGDCIPICLCVTQRSALARRPYLAGGSVSQMRGDFSHGPGRQIRGVFPTGWTGQTEMSFATARPGHKKEGDQYCVSVWADKTKAKFSNWHIKD